MAKIPLGDIDRYQDESSTEKIRKKVVRDTDKKHKKTKRDKKIDWDEISE